MICFHHICVNSTLGLICCDIDVHVSSVFFQLYMLAHGWFIVSTLLLFQLCLIKKTDFKLFQWNLSTNIILHNFLYEIHSKFFIRIVYES